MTSTAKNIIENDDSSRDIVQLGVTDQRIAELRQQYTGLTISDEASYKVVSAAIGELSQLRTAIEARRKSIKAPIIERGKILDAEAARLTGLLQGIETPLFQERTRVLMIEKQKKEEKERLERGRLLKIAEALHDIDKRVGSLELRSSTAIAAELERVKLLPMTVEIYGDRVPDAIEKVDRAVWNLSNDLTLARQIEKDDAERKEAQAKLAAEQAELDRQKREFDEAQRKAAAEQAEKDRQANEERIREEAAKKALADLKAELEARAASEQSEREESARLAAEAEARKPELQKALEQLANVVNAATELTAKDPAIIKILSAAAVRINRACKDARLELSALEQGQNQ